MFDLEAKVGELLESLKGRVLEHIYNGAVFDPQFDGWYLKFPGERAQSTMIAFTPEGIVIAGDLSPCDNRGVISRGYGVGWFASELSPDYLAEKFLCKKYVHAVADEEFRITVKESVECGDMTKERGETALAIWGFVDSDDETRAYEVCVEYFGQYGIEGFGRWYDPRDHALLVATQRQFARLYRIQAQGLK